MLTSLSLVFIVGLSMASICQKVKIPRIIGMLITGIILGPFALDFLSPSILGISAELRRMALIIILIKAGLALDVTDLKKVGLPAILMSFLPALFEIAAFVLFAPAILSITRLEAAIIGAVLGAVSPAVVVPKMVQLMETRYGTKKRIPQMILAGASLDDVFVIVLFSTFVGMEQGGKVSLMDFINVPVSIILGILLGAATGFLIAWFWNREYERNHKIRNSKKTIIILGLAFLLMAIEKWLENRIAVSGLLAVMSMACLIQIKSTETVTRRLSEKFGKLWIAAEVILFVLVGAAVDIRYTLQAGSSAVLLIFISLAFRSLGVLLSITGTDLNLREKIFCVIAYIPKATVQAAIGSIPLSLGLPCGKLVLSVAVLSILITAPLGAFGMDLTYRRFLERESDSN
ncbi:cation:proton antiporter [Treponema sp.]|uniref:cation:proton antiporter n=1 Tax=Treponema sp. TaxID=166 RepID=UPI00388F8CAE